MHPFKRYPAPEFLLLNAERWNQQWSEAKALNLGIRFNWYHHKGIPVNQHLLPPLQVQTQDHCSYCDAYPPKRGDNTIDHFKPKSDPRFYLLAYDWDNLYFACGHCQISKSEKFDSNLLRPDAKDYTFERYFVYNYTNHEIEVNLAANETDQRAAAITIKIFDFNHKGQVVSRRQAWGRWNSVAESDRILDDFNSRFIFL